MKRRTFLKTGAMAGAGLVLTGRHVYGQSPNLAKYVDPLFTAIPTLTPANMGSYDQYGITMVKGAWRFHSRLPVTPAPTLAYLPMPYLGGTIEAKRGREVRVTWANAIVGPHPLAAAIDTTVPGGYVFSETKPMDFDLRAVPHLHGGFIPAQYDGHPESWFTPSGGVGKRHHSYTYRYGNEQRACMLWYHDHAMGMTRLNAYAGLAALYFIRDQSDPGGFVDLVTPGVSLNLPKAPYEIPLVLQDKSFNPDGSLFYPTIGITPTHPKWVPEFFGDVPVVNAVAYPYLNVEPRRYRFRMVNGSQARFYSLWIDNGLNPIPFWQIGNEAGFLRAPVPLTKMLIAPGERADFIVDFTGMAPGTLLTMKNNAKAPYPGGRGGQVSQIMQFRVTALTGPPDTTALPGTLALPPIAALTPGGVVRDIVLIEKMDPVLGVPLEVLLNDKHFQATVTEAPTRTTTEVWQFINITGDAHPMHMHLVHFQILNRQPINAKAFTAAYMAGLNPQVANFLAGPAAPPAPGENGWKDTAIAMPGEVLRIVAKFDLPTVEPSLPMGGVSPQYVYHCHILEHEENDMMRPFEVVG